MGIFFELHHDIPREGPGDNASTRKAWSLLNGLPEEPRILDIGCGPGMQTLELARNSAGSILAVDTHQPFLDELARRAASESVGGKIATLNKSMFELDLEPGFFDVLWSEGAIYNIGFERGLKEWRKFLKSGGSIVVSEASWFTDERPEEIEAFWKNAYPEIDTIPNKIGQLQKAGYIPMAAFILPENCWTKHFYAPQAKAQEVFLNKYAGNKTAEEFISNQRHEERLYYNYKEYYGYVFYIGRKKQHSP